MNQPVFTIRIPVEDERHAGQIVASCKSYGLPYKTKEGGKIIEVEAEDLIDFYYLGANVVALGARLFEGPLTTHAANQHR